MPEVPYTPYPTAEPTGTIPQFRPEVSGEAFGVNIGQAISGFGRQMESSGDEIFRRAVALQDLQNETAAINADAKLSLQANDMYTNFETNNRGANAKDALPKFRESVNGLRESIRAELPNDAARRLYDRNALYTANRTIFSAGRHAATETKSAYKQALDASIDTNLNTVEQFPDDQDLYRRKLGDIHAAIDNKASVEGALPATRQLWHQQAESKAFANHLTGLSKTRPNDAITEFEGNRDKLVDADLQRVENTLYGKSMMNGVRIESDKIIDGSEGKTEKQLIEEAREAADRSPIVDEARRAQYKEDLERTVVTKFNRNQAATRNQTYNDMQTIDGALLGNYGVIPHTPDELERVDPGVASAWSRLPNDKRLTVKRAMENLSKAGMRRDPIESLRERTRIEGIIDSDRDEFLSTDVTTNEKLNVPDMKAINNLQQRLMRNQQGDLHVSHFMTLLRQARGAELDALNIYDRKTDKDSYDAMIGYMRNNIEAFMQKNNNRLPTDNEFLKDVWPNVSRTTKVPGMFYGTNDIPTYKINVPADKIEEIKSKLRDEGGAEPDDDQVKRYYLQDLAIKAAKKVKPAKPATGKAAGTAVTGPPEE